MSPPKVRFLTKIYHPNIGEPHPSLPNASISESNLFTDKLGRICLDILKGASLILLPLRPCRIARSRACAPFPLTFNLSASDSHLHHGFLADKWSPALQIRTVLLSIQALLSAPNPDDPLATDVAKHYKENEADAQRVSREWTEKYAHA